MAIEWPDFKFPPINLYVMPKIHEKDTGELPFVTIQPVNNGFIVVVQYGQDTPQYTLVYNSSEALAEGIQQLYGEPYED